jgi:hypothetical protein
LSCSKIIHGFTRRKTKTHESDSNSEAELATRYVAYDFIKGGFDLAHLFCDALLEPAVFADVVRIDPVKDGSGLLHQTGKLVILEEVSTLKGIEERLHFFHHAVLEDF